MRKSRFVVGYTAKGWELIEPCDHPQRKTSYWMMRHISCGHIQKARTDTLRHFRGIRCRTCWNAALSRRIEHGIYAAIKYRAAQKGWEFSLTKEFLLDLIERQNYKCAITGLPIWFGYPAFEDRPKRFKTASIDRKNSSLPYVENNVQWVHKTVNILKQNLHDDEFLWFASRTVLNHFDRLSSLNIDVLEILARRDNRQIGRPEFPLDKRLDIEGQYSDFDFQSLSRDLVAELGNKLKATVR